METFKRCWRRIGSRTSSSVFVHKTLKAFGDRAIIPLDISEFVTAILSASRPLIKVVAFDAFVDDATLATI